MMRLLHSAMLFVSHLGQFQKIFRLRWICVIILIWAGDLQKTGILMRLLVFPVSHQSWNTVAVEEIFSHTVWYLCFWLKPGSAMVHKNERKQSNFCVIFPNSRKCSYLAWVLTAAVHSFFPSVVIYFCSEINTDMPFF